MATSKRSTTFGFWSAFFQFLLQFGSAIILGLIWYGLIGLLEQIEFLKAYGFIVKSIQYGGGISILAIVLMGSFVNLFKALRDARARNATEKVAQALDQIKDQTPGKNIAEISTQDVAASLKDAKVNDEQLVRLVEQRKQKLLIDDEYFREELSSLIVDYLQPLPRNAKRVLNRFRVNLLIAHSRGLFTSDPKVTAQQIGKWLVLLERWPQLGRSLSAAPEKMKNLEELSARSQLNPEKPDQFMESIRMLALPYLGDEDLRKFIRSAPTLAVVVARLVHYGAAESMSSTAESISS